MFSEEEQKEITIELGKYPHKDAAGLEILKVVHSYDTLICERPIARLSDLYWN